MPEGPEIRREADRIARVLVGATLVGAAFGLARLAPMAAGLVGLQVRAVDTHGKALLTRFSDGRTLYSHNQLYGKWYVCRSDRPPRTSRVLRVALHTPTHSALLMSASSIELLDAEQLAAFPPLARLGPDVLSTTLLAETVAERLLTAPFVRRSLAALYLDQGFIAGIGNYLRSEILHAAELGPRLRPVDLSHDEVSRLARWTLTISRRAYSTAGVTTDPAIVARLREAGKTRRDWRFAVFAREGLPCFRCDTPIERSEAGSRRLYGCPRCQRG
jgi:endonuclease-8